MIGESFNCSVCRDVVVDTVLQCGHLICGTCGTLCELCPLCRTTITSKTKFYLPLDVKGLKRGDGCGGGNDCGEDCGCGGQEMRCHAMKSPTATNNHSNHNSVDGGGGDGGAMEVEEASSSNNGDSHSILLTG